METRPGILTTEFWVTIFMVVPQFLNLIGAWDFISNWHSGILLTVAGAFYTVARGWAKSHASADPGLPQNNTLFGLGKK